MKKAAKQRLIAFLALQHIAFSLYYLRIIGILIQGKG